VVNGILTRKGKVVYRSHRNVRDRVKHTFRLSDIRRICPKVYEDMDPTFFLNETQLTLWRSLERNNLHDLFEIFEMTSDVLQMVWEAAPNWLKIQMLTRLLLNNIIRKVAAVPQEEEAIG